MKTSELAFLMQSLGEALKKLSPHDIQLVLSNKASVGIVVTPSADLVQRNSSKSVSQTPISIDFYMDKLDQSNSREDGMLILKDLNKSQLQILAKHISVSVDSGTSKERIIEKIVERRVGLRLRQNAFAQAMSPV